MLKRVLAALGLAATLLGPAATTIHAQSGCQFVLGFATVAGDLPQQVGSCTDNQIFSPNGDAVQHTSTGGLLVWRKADNWTAFTDGYHTWINGPDGLQERLNTARFSWEPAAPPVSPAPAAAPVSVTAPATPAAATAAAPAGVTAAQIAAIVIPAGYPAMSELPANAQVGCVHFAEDLQKSATQTVTMQGDDFLCPYYQDPTWPGFA